MLDQALENITSLSQDIILNCIEFCSVCVLIEARLFSYWGPRLFSYRGARLFSRWGRV
jgi:hypothetical protein